MVSESQLKTFVQSNFYISLFIIILCFATAVLLGIVAYVLAPTQDEAKDFDRSKQMLIAAKILSPTGEFQILKEDGTLAAAKFDPNEKILVPSEDLVNPTDEEIKLIGQLRIRPLFTNGKGEVFTPEEKKVDLSDYLLTNKKEGYAVQELKLFYAILPNSKEAESITGEAVAKDLSKAEALILPVSGFGLWAPIYGYLAVRSDGDSVIGTTWYDHAETPGLGANITEPWWQKQFFGKLIFQEDSSGKTNFEKAEMGIIVVKGKVKDVYGTLPKAKSAVDGMSGATLTGDGVTAAYRNSLDPYRNLLIKIHMVD